MWHTLDRDEKPEKGKPRVIWGRKIVRPPQADRQVAEGEDRIIQAICLDFFLKLAKVPGTLSSKETFRSKEGIKA